jgi:hypothetical protein
MKKEGIQTRKRKPKNPGQGNQGSPAGQMSSVIKSDMKGGIQHGKLKSYRFICGFQIRTYEVPAKLEQKILFTFIVLSVTICVYVPFQVSS